MILTFKWDFHARFTISLYWVSLNLSDTPKIGIGYHFVASKKISTTVSYENRVTGYRLAN
jgi:hypothetical protein